MFAKNCWYVAALPNELGRALLKRTIAGVTVVMYRTEAGRAVAMLDRCPHRLAPLSMGQLVGDAIQCGYHGVTFDCDGKCIRVPGEQPQAHFRATPYSLLERWGFVWIWLGDADPDEALVPRDFRWLAEPDWCPMSDQIHVGANYQLLIDNLMDLSHEAFLHMNTIGNTAVAEVLPKTTLKGDTIEVERFMPDCTPPKLFVRAAGFTTNIDRFQRIIFYPPCFVVIEVWAVATGTQDKKNGLVWWVLNALTPETERSTNYFWGLPRQFKLDDQEITDALRLGVHRTFEEDKVMIEAQQIILDEVPLESRTVYTKADQAPARARLLIEKMIVAERKPTEVDARVNA